MICLLLRYPVEFISLLWSNVKRIQLTHETSISTATSSRVSIKQSCQADRFTHSSFPVDLSASQAAPSSRRRSNQRQKNA